MNNKLIQSRRVNSAKTFIILTIMFVFIVGLGFLLSILTNNINYIWGSMAISFIVNIASYFFSDSIALSSSGATEANPDEYRTYYNIVKKLTSKAAMPMPRLYIINDASPNAFATGRNENNAAVAVTTGLLSMMSDDELEGVIAHELSHIRNKDILVMSVVVIMTGIFTTLSHFLMNIMLSDRKGENSNSNIFLIAIAAAASILLPIASIILQASISRKREFMADASGALLAENSTGLANALRKIGSVNVPMHNANQATAHLFISNPFANDNVISIWQRLFMTHPPIEERIDNLLN